MRISINDEIGIIEASRILSKRPFSQGLDNDPDVITFIAIDSATDHLPIGEVRKLWNPEMLLQKDKEIAEAEKFYRERAREACKRLIKKISDSIEESDSVNLE
ncbi:MAG TPA: hypothetical protein VJT54_09220 [Verrucomicrobiae bacterium]|nr:hypothetical protein [Verrucomicrobiae bacterium]